VAADPVEEFKARQRETWALGDFGEVAVFTSLPAAHLVRFAGVRAEQSVLDVACGTGVVAVTAARRRARASGLDLTPELLEQARRSSALAGVDVDWRLGDAEALPWPDGSFDVVLSQFGHMFAPRPEVALAELLRVLKPGGTLAFATWPPEHFIGRSFALSARYVPPPAGIPSPVLWGDVGVVAQRLAGGTRDVHFERGVVGIPALSPEHFFAWQSVRIGPFMRGLQALSKEPARLEAYRKEYLSLAGAYLADNVVRHDYLLTRATRA
jgi:SAM-dependent methyltransferase